VLPFVAFLIFVVAF